MEINQKIIDHLSNLNDDELTALFIEQIRIKKDNGSLGDIEKLIKVIGPMLNDNQRARLLKIIQSIKNQ